MCEHNSAVTRPQACYPAHPYSWELLLAEAAAAGADVILVKVKLCVDFYVSLAGDPQAVLNVWQVER
jgi:hypothetical protein